MKDTLVLYAVDEEFDDLDDLDYFIRKGRDFYTEEEFEGTDWENGTCYTKITIRDLAMQHMVVEVQSEEHTEHVETCSPFELLTDKELPQAEAIMQEAAKPSALPPGAKDFWAENEPL